MGSSDQVDINWSLGEMQKPSPKLEAPLIAQLVKNPPAVQVAWFLSQEDRLEKG